MTKEEGEESEQQSPDFSFPFFTKPVQRQRWGDTQIHPHTNWGDTFFDLFYVSAYVPQK